MKKIFYLISLSLFSLLISGPGFSQSENYDAVYLQLKKEYTLNPDGSFDYHYMKKQKLQTYRSFHNLYGETFIVYDPDFQNLKVNEAYTIMSDGKKNPSPANAFNEVLPGFAVNAPAYNKLREMVITHSGTERNAVLNLDYVLHSKKGFYPCLMGNELLCEAEPVNEMIFIVRVPSGSTLRYETFNSTTEPVVSKDGNLDVYTWKYKDIPAISTEELQKGGNDLYPRIIFSSATDRNSVYKAFMLQPAFSYELSPDIKNNVAAIISENKEKSDIMLKLQDKVINELRLYPIPMKLTHFSARTPVETWNSNGGTLLEKAFLLAVLLKEAGFEANPVLMVRNSVYNESIGSLLDVDDVLIKTELSGGPVFLSVSTLNPQNLVYNAPEKVFVELKKNEIRVEKTTQFKNTANMNASFTINEKYHCSGEINIVEDHGTNPYLMLLRDKTKVKFLVGGGLSASDLKDPGIIKTEIDKSSMVISVQKDNGLRVDSDYLFLQLPILSNGIDALGIHLLPKNRTTPFEVSSVMEENYDFTYVVPEKLKPFIPNEKKEIKNSIGSFSFEVKTEGSKVFIHRYIKLEKKLISPTEYPDFKTIMDHWNADRYREVVFKKQG